MGGSGLRDGGQVFRFPGGVPPDVAVARHAVHGPGTFSAKGSRQQPLPRLDETVLPGKPIEPAIRNVAQAVEGTGELPRRRGYRIGVVGQVGGEEHHVPEIAGAGDRPDNGLQCMHDIAA